MNVAQYAVEMRDSGLSVHFVASAVELATEEQGAYDLLELWHESDAKSERDKIVADLQGAIDEFADAASSGPL
jgi:hypothetical protein